jgi:hypothetical protein
LADLENIWVLAGPIAGLYYLTIRQEERHLATRYPESWPRYAAVVPRLLPWRRPASLTHVWSKRQWLARREYNAVIASLLGLIGLAIWRRFL